MALPGPTSASQSLAGGCEPSRQPAPHRIGPARDNAVCAPDPVGFLRLGLVNRVAWPAASLRRLRVAGLVAPILFIALLLSLRPHVLDRLGHDLGFTVLGGILITAAAAFGLAMYRLLDRAHRDLLGRNRASAEANAVNDALADLLLRVARSEPLPATLDALTVTARDLLDADAVALLLDADSAVAARRGAPRPCSTRDGYVCVASASEVDAPAGCPRHSRRPWLHDLALPLTSTGEASGELWVGRRRGVPFDADHRAVGATLAGLATVALDHSRVVDAQARAAALGERERIARELHDSLAQVLGVTHLRLLALADRAELAGAPRSRGELAELAELAHEAYRDVREAILGLRDATRADQTLLEQLERYVQAFSRTSRIPTTLRAESGADLRLTPAAEVQVIRVIQEALTNVRKHSGARRASVSVRQDAGHTVFVVEDDGTGFDPAAAADGDRFGLHAMRERTESVDGRFTIDSGPGAGTRIVVALPGRHVPPLPSEELTA